MSVLEKFALGNMNPGLSSGGLFPSTAGQTAAAGSFNPSLSGSFSRHSLQGDGSEIISEAEEINEVRLLQKKGDECMNAENYESAVRFYTEALEIDEMNVNLLKSRCAAYLGTKSYQQAFKDAETLISFNASQPQAHYLHGVTLDYLGKSQHAILAFLNALDLDLDNGELLTDHILVLTGNLCSISDDRVNQLKEMDAYRKLTEVGCYLFHEKKYDLCIKVLSCARRLETNQKGIAMKILLTAANAHSALDESQFAITRYEECYKLALAAHDPQYQCKSLVSIASLYLEQNLTEQAVFYYEKLKDLESEVTGDGGDSLPRFWTIQLRRALRLNLSIGYKKIGIMNKALENAREYLRLLDEESDDDSSDENLRRDSHYNIGMLHEILGDFERAIAEYREYERLSRETENSRGTARAYGCLGGIYAHLKHWKLSDTYLEQQIDVCSRIGDEGLINDALEQRADAFMMRSDIDSALDIYSNIAKNCGRRRGNRRTKCNALLKLGIAYRKQRRFQYAAHYLDEALFVARDEKYNDLELACEFNMAAVDQHSTQVFDLERGRKLFEKLIPIFEAKIAQAKEEESYCSEETLLQLAECYSGIQLVLSKIGTPEETLRYSEAARQQTVITDVGEIVNLTSSLIDLNTIRSDRDSRFLDSWSLNRLLRVVDQQSATVIYYTVTGFRLLLWLLQPGRGIVRFYSTKSESGKTMTESIVELIGEFVESPRFLDAYNYESRSLPRRHADLHNKQKEFSQLSNEDKQTKGTPTPSGGEISKRPIEKRLFDLLFSSVGDILMKLKDGSQLVIIPDGVLARCPFHAITNWSNVALSERFRITYCQSLSVLEKVTINELDQLKIMDDLEFERNCVKNGGLNNYSNLASIGRSPEPGATAMCGSPEQSAMKSRINNLRNLSNPLLVRSTIDRPRLKKNGGIPPLRKGPVRRLRDTGRWHDKGIPKFSAGFARFIGANAFTTIATKTATNTDIVSSNSFVTQFRQCSDKDRAVVIGNPLIPDSVMLHGKPWNCKQRPQLDHGQQELLKVSSYLNVEPIVGLQATKSRFLQEFKSASLIHITTFGCLKEGLLVLTPNENQHLIKTKTTAKLIVLSSAWSLQNSSDDQSYLLPSAFIAAGAQCVLYFLWPLSVDALDKFYYHFYRAMEHGCLVTAAVNSAVTELSRDDRFASIHNWAAAILIGRDVFVDVTVLRHSMLDQTLDQIEVKVAEFELKRDPLNPTDRKQVADAEENMNKLQQLISTLLTHHKDQPTVITRLIQLLDNALKRLFKEDLNGEVESTSAEIENGHGAVDLLKYVGFHFQPRRAELTELFIVFPHWDYEELLVPAYDALRATHDLINNPGLIQALVDILPANQETISYMVDMLCITKHASDIQLKLSDLSVKSLWQDVKIKLLLTTIGFQPIGQIVTFNSTPANRLLLNGVLQLILSTSCYKSPVLMHKLDVNMLGTQRDAKVLSSVDDAQRLPTLMPLILRKHQLRTSTPWLSAIEIQGEMNEKMKLAHGKTHLSREFTKHLQQAKTWHEKSLHGQAEESLKESVKPKPSLPPGNRKVKVKSGDRQVAPSQTRTPVDRRVELTLKQTEERRDHSHYILQHRLNNIHLHHKHHNQKLYLPYVVHG
ncbi:uncharacterized protein LOC141908946 isoform X2 [Tubulanus polymorphus]|uniref:uncharacterized protein LOC141908946 isoform X2 n=1 Tax=Tubulanus polymorphus TaxID=672921 RepID=UPI003DA638D5